MKLRPRSLNSGFTLAELLIVVAIFIIITGVVLYNQNRFSSEAGIRNLAYQIALSVRQAQSYGLSVRGEASGSTNFSGIFGLHFDTATPGSYIFFSDTNLNNQYDTGEKISDFVLENGNTLNGLFVNIAGNSRPQKTVVDITFKRPNPEPIISAVPSSANINSVEIIVQSALKDRTQTIWVTQNGQIYVTN